MTTRTIRRGTAALVRLLIHDDLSYNEEGKVFFLREGKRTLEALAKAAGLEKGTYSVRTNPGGVAVSGEVTLHGEDIYVMLSQSGSPGLEILARRCKSRDDYVGESNRWLQYTELLDLPQLAAKINSIRSK